MEIPAFCFKFPAPLSLRFSARRTTSSFRFFTLFAVCYDAVAAAAAAALLCDTHGRCFCAYACALLYVCGWGVCCHRHARRSRRAVCFFATAAALHSSHKIVTRYTAAQQQYSRWGTTAAALHAVRCMCLWLMHHSRISNHGNINTSNATVERTSSDLIAGTRRIQHQNQYTAVAQPVHIIGMPVSPRDMKPAPSRRVTSYCIRCLTVYIIPPRG